MLQCKCSEHGKRVIQLEAFEQYAAKKEKKAYSVKCNNKESILTIRGDYMKKGKSYILVFLALVIGLFTIMPYIKLWIYTNHYERIGGTYILLDQNQQIAELNLTNPIHIKVSPNDGKNSVKLTNIIYYEKLKQISFGVISEDDAFKTMELKLVNQNQDSVGRVLTTGTTQFYNKSLEKLYIQLSEPLMIGEEYRVQILDADANIIKEIFIKRD